MTCGVQGEGVVFVVTVYYPHLFLYAYRKWHTLIYFFMLTGNAQKWMPAREQLDTAS